MLNQVFKSGFGSGMYIPKKILDPPLWIFWRLVRWEKNYDHVSEAEGIEKEVERQKKIVLRLPVPEFRGVGARAGGSSSISPSGLDRLVPLVVVGGFLLTKGLAAFPVLGFLV